MTFESFQYDNEPRPTQALVVTMTPDDIEETLELELQRQKYEEALLGGRLGAHGLCPSKSYCASCPVANAVWRLADGNDDVYDVQVDGVEIVVALSTAPRDENGIRDPDDSSYYWYQDAVLPQPVANWIDMFDSWLKDDRPEGTTARVAYLEDLLADKQNWPELPEPFQVTFQRGEG